MTSIKKFFRKQDKIALPYSTWQIFSLTFLRVLIGWHFLFEGLVKLFSTPAWTAKSYLIGSVGPFSPAFKAMASNHTVQLIIDNLNIWGLILIGLSLFVGLFAKYAKLSGIVLLLFYYLAYPPFAFLIINTPVEGNYWIVNKNFIEMAALFVLFLFPSSQITGIDRYLQKKSENK
jgi:thiosulfate dehydrogenase (quinone) large subunit